MKSRLFQVVTKKLESGDLVHDVVAVSGASMMIVFYAFTMPAGQHSLLKFRLGE